MWLYLRFNKICAFAIRGDDHCAICVCVKALHFALRRSNNICALQRLQKWFMQMSFVISVSTLFRFFSLSYEVNVLGFFGGNEPRQKLNYKPTPGLQTILMHNELAHYSTLLHYLDAH